MAFTDSVGTLRPFNINKTVSSVADLPQPVFVGETTVTFNNNDNKLYFAMRKDLNTVLKGEVPLS